VLAQKIKIDKSLTDVILYCKDDGPCFIILPIPKYSFNLINKFLSFSVLSLILEKK